jgi:hypothetical protein
MVPFNHPSGGCHRISRNGIDMANNSARNIFSLAAFTLKILKIVWNLPTRSIDCFQGDGNAALRLISE